MFIKANRLSVLISGICALILSMGIARYSFTPMIPQMQAQAGVSESLAGWLAGWNYMGYLTGLFVVWLLTDLRAKDFFFRYGLVVSIIATLVMAASDHRLVWYMSRYVAGVSTATGFMLGTGLILNWLHHHGYKSELGLHFAGIGAGICVSAAIVDATTTGGLLEINWRVQWVTLAGVAALLIIPAALLLPRPTEKEKEMTRDEDIGIGKGEGWLPTAKWLWMMQIAYFCAGFGNTVNVTFTSMITEMQPIPDWGAKMWMLVGLAAIPSPFIWDRISRKIGRLNSLRIAFVLNMVGNITLALTNSKETTMAAAIMFGFTFMGIVSLTLSTVGHIYGAKATNIMARLTFGYCIAQILSPVLSGIIAEQTGSFQLPLFIISGIMAIGLICIMLISNQDRQAVTVK